MPLITLETFFCCLRWAVSNREMLIAQNSSLEFKLHRLYFISLLMGGTTNQREALQYAKNFQPFALNHQKGESGIRLLFSFVLWGGSMGKVGRVQGVEIVSGYSSGWSQTCDPLRSASRMLGVQMCITSTAWGRDLQCLWGASSHPSSHYLWLSYIFAND